MRCYCCDHILTPQESTRRFKESGVFTDMCNSCLNSIAEEDIETVDGVVMDDQLFDEEGNPREED